MGHESGNLVGSVVFRTARPDESGIIARLINAAYRGDTSRAGWTTEADLLDGRRTDEAEVRGLIEGDESIMLLCLDGDEIVGTVHLQREGDVAHLGLFVVEPSLQGRGIGKHFLEEAEGLVRDRWGSRKMTMWVISVRDELIAFYERRGYLRTGQRKPFPAVALSTPLVPGLDFEVLVKDLTAPSVRRTERQTGG